MSSERSIPFRITQASLNQTAFDYPRNIKNILDAIDAAVDAGSDLLSLEELTLTGYDAGDDFQKTDNAQIGSILQDIAHYAHAKNPNLVISLGHPWFLTRKDVPQGAEESERRKNVLFNRINLPFNVQTFIGHGRILGMTAKNYLFNYERGYEKRYFPEWSMADADLAGGVYGTISITLPGQKKPIPFGRPILQLKDGSRGINLTHVICEEKWIGSPYDETPGDDRDYDKDGVIPSIARRVGRNGLLVIVPNASPPAPLKIDKHIRLDKLASRYADAIIDTDGLGTSGATFAQFGFRMIVQDENVTTYGNRLSFARTAATSSTIMLSPADENGASKIHAVVPHTFTAAAPNNPRNLSYLEPGNNWDHPENPDRATEELVRMNALWLFDYMRKAGTRGIAEALSGGADSAYNTTLVALTVRLAVAELGVDGFCREMGHLRYGKQILEAWREQGEDAAIDTCLSHMLTGVFMGTQNNSDESRSAARLLMEGGMIDGVKVKGIGGTFVERDVQEILDIYGVTYAAPNLAQAEPSRRALIYNDLVKILNAPPSVFRAGELLETIERLRETYPEITGDILSAADPRYGIAYENIQARARQVLIMLVANAEGKMAIANPNLDEARNAYATFGGDLHSGTVNLNAFLSKPREIEVLRHLCEKGLQGIPPLTCLKPILRMTPSAQLQPKDAAGNVTQTDENALQRNLPQMERVSQHMLYDRIGIYKERRLNPTDVFKACATDDLFHGTDEDALYNMVRLSYGRWWMGQHKVHASPIAPTFGRNVDHQVSLRTPNLSGCDQAELAQLGVKLLFNRARKEFGDRPCWSREEENVWHKRALMDEAFVGHFAYELTMGGSPTQTYSLNALYERLRPLTMEAVFRSVPPHIRTLAQMQAKQLAVT